MLDKHFKKLENNLLLMREKLLTMSYLNPLYQQYSDLYGRMLNAYADYCDNFNITNNKVNY